MRGILKINATRCISWNKKTRWYRNGSGTTSSSATGQTTASMPWTVSIKEKTLSHTIASTKTTSAIHYIRWALFRTQRHCKEHWRSLVAQRPTHLDNHRSLSRSQSMQGSLSQAPSASQRNVHMNVSSALRLAHATLSPQTHACAMKAFSDPPHPLPRRDPNHGIQTPSRVSHPPPGLPTKLALTFPHLTLPTRAPIQPTYSMIKAAPATNTATSTSVFNAPHPGPVVLM